MDGAVCFRRALTYGKMSLTIHNFCRVFSQGNPELRLALNEDLVVGKANAGSSFGSVVLDVSHFNILIPYSLVGSFVRREESSRDISRKRRSVGCANNMNRVVVGNVTFFSPAVTLSLAVCYREVSSSPSVGDYACLAAYFLQQSC